MVVCLRENPVAVCVAVAVRRAIRGAICGG